MQKQQIIVTLDVDGTSELYNSFILVLKGNGKLQLSLDPARLNKVPIMPVHRGPTLNNILLKLADIKYLILTDENMGYDNLKLDEQSSYLKYLFLVYFAGMGT